jgi:hypothetical protein
MEIVCESCGARLSIDEGKLPPGATVQATCPRCQAKLRLEVRPPAEPEGYSAQMLERYEEGVSLALVLHEDDETANLVGQELVSFGYRISRAHAVAEACARIKLNTYDLIVLQDRFGAAAGCLSPVLAHLNALPMVVRRKMFVVLAGEKLTTGDRMEAFVRSVNLTVADAELGGLSKLLKNSIAEHELFYRLFHETALGLGRA